MSTNLPSPLTQVDAVELGNRIVLHLDRVEQDLLAKRVARSTIDRELAAILFREAEKRSPRRLDAVAPVACGTSPGANGAT